MVKRSIKKSTTAKAPVGFQRVPFKNALPIADAREARLFRLLGDNPSKTKLSRLPHTEVNAETSSLATILMRAVYHRRRFKWIVVEANERYAAFSPKIVFDQIAKYIAFEAASYLNSARSFVDVVYHVARRRGGAALDEIPLNDGVSNALRESTSPGHALPEVTILRNHHATWFSTLNGYRNAMIHIGGQEALGFHPVGSSSSQATDATGNVMLLPDLKSLRVEYLDAKGKKKHRSTRPHEWRYREGVGLEDTIETVHAGLLKFARRIGESWGGAVPPAGSDELADAVVLRS
jgi:hypothetical protein